jgi:hypothetical protein
VPVGILTCSDILGAHVGEQGARTTLTNVVIATPAPFADVDASA